ncbi:MAG: DNA-binding protein [Clostridiaceae bacterium]|nr:DNA-binding protein [Clostridiaceae bacterium]
MNINKEEKTPWICDKCNKELQLSQVNVVYLGGNFEVELMQCPQCKMVIIDEKLALGKMLEVEKGLEDK